MDYFDVKSPRSLAQTSDQGIAVWARRFWRQVGVRVVRES